MTRAISTALLWIALSAVAQTSVPDAAQFVGAPQGRALTGAELEQRATEVSALLRCPVCQGLSVADSHADMAVNMKRQVRELLARGFTEEQVLRYFERSYGEFVLLKPKFQGINALVWTLPLLALIAGGAIVYAQFKRLRREPAATAQPASDDPYLARVRDLVGDGKNS